MRRVLFIVFVIFLQVYKVVCESGFGSVFPIPLSISNDDPNFLQCPVESGAYAHTTNCSLFHMCTFGIHTMYSCIDGFFFNPTSGKCQYLPVEKELKCADILKQMMNIDLFPVAQEVRGYDYYHRRKSAKSTCTQSGIYPDVLDCSLFHYCHQDKQHEIFKCPKGLHFDSKIFMCSAPQLVNCQYEPPTEPTVTEDEVDRTSTIKSNTICHNYAAGTRLPVANKFDEFVICENNDKSTLVKCKPGFSYNALTTNCEMKPCAMDSTLCKNNGQCVNDATNVKGFQCICSIEYQGEYCDKPIESVETTKRRIDTSTVNLLRYGNHLNDNDKSLTTTTNTKVKVDFLQKTIAYIDPESQDKISIIEKTATVNSPLSRMLHRLTNDYDNQQLIASIIQIIFITIMVLIGLLLLGSVIFGVAICIRLLSFSPAQTVGTWKILNEESKV